MKIAFLVAISLICGAGPLARSAVTDLQYGREQASAVMTQ
jgi:hypothetical protein